MVGPFWNVVTQFCVVDTAQRHMDGITLGSDRPHHLKTWYSWGVEFLFLCCYTALVVLLLVNKQVQLPTQQKSNMDERVDVLYDWVESPQGQTAPQEITAEDRTALEGSTRGHSSANHWCHINCLFIPNGIVFCCPLGVSDNKQNSPSQRQWNWCKHFNTGSNKDWIICCCYFKWEKLQRVFSLFNLL